MPVRKHREPRRSVLEGSTHAVETPCELATSEQGAIGRTLERLRAFASSDEPMLLQGETGTGKSHLAHWAHLQSSRVRAPFHRVNLAGLDDGIASSELFGHLPGAFTDARAARSGAFATANHGTLFLDEIGKATTVVQRKLLDVMERRSFRPVGSDREVSVNVRLIFAANESLEALVDSGRMLRDFVPRLGFFRIEIPPLRERSKDIPALIRFFVDRYAPRFGWSADAPPTIAPSLSEALEKHSWPDNVRGLENLVRRLLVDGRGSAQLSAALLVGDLACYDRRSVRAGDRVTARIDTVRAAIQRNGGNRSRAARELGMSRSRLYDYDRMARAEDERATS